MNTSQSTSAMHLPSAPPTDAELVDRFVSARDPDAILELVCRHGPIILGVGRRVLRDGPDIEDVFQATILVLIRNAARVRRQQSIASWLYGVAYRLSTRLNQQKRQRRETILSDDLPSSDGTFEIVADRHDQQVVDAELNALPERYRVPLVLRYLFDQSPGDISRTLGITKGTLDGLLKRGKDLLRAKLMRRGITLSTALAVVQASQQAVQAACQSALIERTIPGALSNPWDPASVADHITSQARDLSQKEIVAMSTFTKSSLVTGIAAGLIGVGFAGIQFFGSSHRAQVEAGPITQLRSNLSAAATASQGVVGQDLAEAAPETDKTVKAADHVDAEIGAPHPGRIEDLKRRNKFEQKIEKAFAERTQIAFTENPLEEVVKYLEDLHHIEIWIDTTALADEGISTDQPISLVMSGISLQSAMRLILEPLGLDYVIKNEVVAITTRGEADAFMEVRAYDVSHLQGTTTPELDEIIRGTVSPSSWSSERQAVGPSMRMGGLTDSRPQAESVVQMGTASLIRTGLATEPEKGPAKPETPASLGSIRYTTKTLVIRQSQRVHAEIADLLNQLLSSHGSTPHPTGNTAEAKY